MSDETLPPIPPAGEKPEIVSFPLPDDSHVQTFHLQKANLRGRLVRLSGVLNDILGPFNYPEPVEKLVSETVVLTTLLSSMLKYEGIFILQAQGDGAVSRLVADITSQGEIRANAGYDPEKLKDIKSSAPTIHELMGDGYLAFTVDQGEFSERYQGIVKLEGNSLQDSIHHYFAQSEQIGTAIRMAVKKDEKGAWSAGAIMLQHMPDHANIPQDAKPISEDWNRGQILLQTCKDEELLDPRLHDDTLLYRLFHEEGVVVYPAQKIKKVCRCSMDKIMRIVSQLKPEDRDDIVVDGKITMTCEFCNTHYSVDPKDIPQPTE
jgi:molecular chaperone Hsp33